MAFPVLVTGGAGYIGRHVLRALREAGCEPYWLDVRQGEGLGIVADMTDYPALAAAIDKIGPAGVIHLAAHSSVAESMARPHKYRENATMCRHLAKAAKGLPTVLASSAAVYGEGAAGPLIETMRPAPVNPYGWSKLESEAELPRATALRFFNVAGGDGDEGDHIVPMAAKACARGEAVRLDGGGVAVRDFVHVEDAARATVQALLALSVGRPPEVLNICSGRGCAVRVVVAACAAVSGKPMDYIETPPRAGDVKRLIGDNARALKAIGWAPRYDLTDIVSSAWRAAA